MSSIPRHVVLLAALLPAASVQAGVVYKWVDGDGRTYYGDRPGHAGAMAIRLQPAPEPAPDFAHRERVRNRLLQWFADDREAQRREADRQAAIALQQQQACERARDRLYRYTYATALYHLDDTGNRRIIFDIDERNALEERARAAVDRHCR